MTALDTIGLIPLFPLLGFIVLVLGNRRLSQRLVAAVGCGSLLASCALAGSAFFGLGMRPPEARSLLSTTLTWLDLGGGLRLDFGFLFDPLSAVFVLIITFVGLLIHIYSVGYLWTDPGLHRYFAFLNLFVFFMLLLVMGKNLVVTFVGWEGVGLCSYLLIGFWSRKEAGNEAAKKAFVMNRVGDAGFLLGLLWFAATFGSLEYDALSLVGTKDATDLMIIGLLFFVGAAGKSAQFPLYGWLPDAMAGPTPASALIHAATMVTSGIYLLARCNAVYVAAPVAQGMVAVVGAFTALAAAVVALTQNDIKRVLAYSTVSQLGFMFLGLGSGAPGAAIFHVTTHAFFKALLFLGAGSVIHALHGEQDIRRMGGLGKPLPVTRATFLVGTLAIAGLPPFSGFFSKEELLGHVLAYDFRLWILALAGSALTAFYMLRLYLLVFGATFRGTPSTGHLLHEAPASMAVPLVALAFLSLFGGWLGVPHVIGALLGHPPHFIGEFLASVLPVAGTHEGAVSTEAALGCALAAAALGASYAFVRYYLQNHLPAPPSNALVRFISEEYRLDRGYALVAEQPMTGLGKLLSTSVEPRIGGGVPTASARVAFQVGALFRRAQTGDVGFYALLMTLAAALLLLIDF